MFKSIKDVIGKVIEFIQKNPKLTVLIVLVLFAGYLYAMVEALHISSEPKFCQMCHPEKKTGPLSEVYTWSKNIHASKEVECLDCHGAPGFVGYMKAKIGGLGDIYGFVAKSTAHRMEVLTRASTDAKYAAELLPNETCLFCHTDSYNQKIRKERIMSVGVRFRKLDGVVNPAFRKSAGLKDILTEDIGGDINPNHKKHIEAGVNCVDCHLGVAHGGEFRNKVKIERCVACHEQRKSAISMSDITLGSGDKTVVFSHKAHVEKFKCTECHTRLFPMKKGSVKIAFADHTKNKFCYSCHNNRKAFFDCNTCHTRITGPKEAISFGTGKSAVKFIHSIHKAKFKCTECHTRLFQMKKGSSKVTFADHSKDRLCYACHNNKKAPFTCGKCHAVVPSPKAPLVYTPAGMAPVRFSHEFHTGIFACTECHTKIWPMQRGVKKMAMDDLYQGKFCGSCHNGTTAFEATQCDKCHTEK